MGFKAMEINEMTNGKRQRYVQDMAREVGWKSMRSRKPREQVEDKKRGVLPHSLIKI